jgi:3-carboxy-cis,cis-muconate cycloisomerase
LPQACLLAAGSLAQAQFMLSSLIVEPAAMKRNLDSTRGLIVAEAVMMGLAPALGRQSAHDEVYAACRDAFDRGDGLLDALLRRPVIASALPRDQLAALCEPSNYLGTAGAMVDRVLARQARRQIQSIHPKG